MVALEHMNFTPFVAPQEKNAYIKERKNNLTAIEKLENST